ncbi:flavin-containing monooxygenase [Microbacterium elymi]|uniref:NAD(P)/FAD-dependent oxidoreductase n=1 Tax=Microbacterium elymi TaxID=2909587 RepID=A0ABY5NH59_9MICO|nr:NAD(P)/FAD-dependent oxidoreductase [Microbacterium elymi]UUT34522.1 NAD(P)/FAD-dependent oxidoreductase [Microbacterium elymi]
MTHAEVVVVGAGFAGLAAVMALRAQGIEDVVVLERAASLGGTWRDNTYPGVACDVPSHLYGFAGHPNPRWSGVFARGDEIRAYLEHVAAAERIAPWLETPMLDARWDAGAWRIRTGGARPGKLTADALVLACGRLTEPRIPDIPGLESFPGPMFHSARWDHRAALDGARVGVIGTGASAVQLVPQLARTADVTLFQRTPAWIVPREDRPYTPAEQATFAAHPDALARLRDELYREGEARYASRSGDADAAAAARAVALTHLHTQVADPALRAVLTPDYAFGLQAGRCCRTRSTRRWPPARYDWSRRPSPPSPAARSSPRPAPGTTWTCWCWPPGSSRPASRTPSWCTARPARSPSTGTAA